MVKAASEPMTFPRSRDHGPDRPGVTHRWTNLTAFTDEVANARIWSGFHYRFSTRAGTNLGLHVGQYVAKSVMQPVESSSR